MKKIPLHGDTTPLSSQQGLGSGLRLSMGTSIITKPPVSSGVHNSVCNIILISRYLFLIYIYIYIYIFFNSIILYLLFHVCMYVCAHERSYGTLQFLVIKVIIIIIIKVIIIVRLL